MINRRWIGPPATWNAKNPSSHSISKIANSPRNILNLLLSSQSLAAGTASPVLAWHLAASCCCHNIRPHECPEQSLSSTIDQQRHSRRPRRLAPSIEAENAGDGLHTCDRCTLISNLVLTVVFHASNPEARRTCKMRSTALSPTCTMEPHTPAIHGQVTLSGRKLQRCADLSQQTSPHREPARREEVRSEIAGTTPTAAANSRTVRRPSPPA